MTKRNQRLKRKLAETIKRLSLEREDVCESCNNSKGLPGSWAHIVSRNDCIGLLEDLYFDENNLIWLCMGELDGVVGCHDVYDRKPAIEKVKLNVWPRIEQFLKQHQPRRAQSILLAVGAKSKVI